MKFREKRLHLFFLVSLSIFYITLCLIKFSNDMVYYDEGIYFAIADYMQSLGRYGFFEPFRPLMLPALLVPFQMLPVSSLISGRILGMLLSLFSGFVVYHVARRHFGKEAALFSFFFFTTSFAMLNYGGYILVDIPAYAMLLLAASYLITKENFISGIFLGLGFLFKFPVIASFPAFLLVVFLLLDKRREFYHIAKDLIKKTSVFLSGFGIVILPYLVFNLLYYEGGFFTRLLRPFVEANNIVSIESWLYSLSSPFRYLFQFLTTEPVVFFLGIIGVVFLMKKKKERLLLFVPLAIFLYFAFYVLRYDERYMISVLLFFYVISGYAVRRMMLHTDKIILIVMVAFIVSLVNYGQVMSMEMRHDDYLSEFLKKSDKILSNSAYVFLYNEDTELKAGPNLGRTFSNFMLENYSVFALDVYGYPCHEDDGYCMRQKTRQLNWIIENNNAFRCGFFHGSRFIIIDKDEKKRQRERCLEELEMSIVNLSSEPEFFIRLDANITKLGEEQVQKKILALADISELYLVIENYGRGEKEHHLAEDFLREQENLSLGLFMRNLSWIPDIETKLGRKVKTVVHKDNDFPPYPELPGTIENCIRGSWDLSPVDARCDSLDIFFTEKNDFEIERKRLIALKKGDHRIGVMLSVQNLEKHYDVIVELLR